MSKLPTTLWGAINRAKLDIRKFHLEKDAKKKESLREKALAAIANADNVVGPGPKRFMSSRHNWRREVLYLNYYEEDVSVGRYWEDDKEVWNLETMPSWAFNPDLKIHEPNLGTKVVLHGKEYVYKIRPAHFDP
jgi:hypothetical protein